MLNLLIEPGGEKYYSLAQNKLRQLKEMMKRSGLRAFSQWVLISDSDKIFINSCDVGNGVSLDLIKIFAGTLRYLYTGTVDSTIEPSLTQEFTGVAGNGTYTHTATVSGVVVSTHSGSVSTTYTGPDYPVDGVETQTYIDSRNGSGLSGSFRNGSLITTCVASFCTPDGSTITDDPVVSSAFWLTALAAAEAANNAAKAALFTDGMLNAVVAQAADAGHPAFTPAPPVIFANGETIIVAWLEYTYDSSVGSFPPVGAVISKVSLIAATKYKYDATAATWSLVGPVKIYDTIAGVRTEVAYLDHDTTTNYGNIVFASEKPLVHQGATGKELETTYAAQVATLKPPADPAAFDILKFVRDALFPRD